MCERVLNLGCGMKPVVGAVNVDAVKLPHVDVVHDLNVVPYPFETDAFEIIYMTDVLEHLLDVVPTMAECHRILIPGGVLRIRTTCWDTRQSYTDPTHKHWFNEESFDFFDPSTHWGANYGWYYPKKFRRVYGRRDGEELIFELRVTK